MAYKATTLTQEVTAIDIHPMGKMSAEDYDEYIRHGLIYLDHHEVLRSMRRDTP